MSVPPRTHEIRSPLLAWLFAGFTGFGGPIAAILYLANTPHTGPLSGLIGLILAVSLMGAGIIGAAAAGRFWIGVCLSLAAGALLTICASGLTIVPLLGPAALGLAVIIASISFAARGALFAISGASKGWWIALAVVAGEGAIVITAIADPDALPGWLLALLPAQWATIALRSALAGGGIFAAYSALIALGGTAAATLFVAALWPRRWTYIVMFSVWLSLSALVYHHPAPSSAAGEPTLYGEGSQATE